MRFKAEMMNETAIKRALVRMSHEIIEHNHGTDNLIFAGIKRRGYPLAKIMAQNILTTEGSEIKVIELDASLFRDDLDHIAQHKPDINVNITGCKVVLVDDVLYTGRTARAAMEALIKCGRPASIQLAVLINRGHRELPIHADYVGKNLPTSKKEIISVKVKDIDGEFSVTLYDSKHS